MAFNLNKKSKVISEINVTPLVDVMLVLLVIFMISTPLMLNGIDLNLPKTKKVSKVHLSTKQLVLSIDKAGKFFVEQEEVAKEKLVSVIKKRFTALKNKTLYLRADSKLEYGIVADIMTTLKSSGITQLALITEIKKR